ncbi:hypothetical protein CHU92_14810 [Flavobacterium cyanobacteriorum]|uniref:Lipoprotein n=1 Tax=Flavobacterium cyanobacteriorum TaxID=2022802 RepID=A0A255YUN5_9FLAO|nr:hypothetical protein [Flavobacterium cyanobacteriorum]OYQ32140.1 hypothetical protein CHU92_14810 [Flavobacterium cyanobacteriorum]
MKIFLRPFSIASLLIAFGCADNSSHVGTDTESTIKPSTKRVASINYTEQIPFVTVNDIEAFGDFEEANSIQAKIDDPSVTWETFDALYSNSLASDVKQNLLYLILVKKDFIGYVKQYPTSKNIEKLKKYITDLVAEKYIGFTVLYESLKALQQVSSSHSKFVSQKADQIEMYATEAVFHQDMLNQGIDGGISQVTYDKIQSDLANLRNIGSL